MLRAVVDRSSSRSNSQSPAGNPDPESNDLHSSFGSEVTTPRLKQWLSKKNFGHHERALASRINLTSINDLAVVEPSDLEDAGFFPLERRRFIAAVRSVPDYHSLDSSKMEMSELSSGPVESSDHDDVKLLDEVKLIIRLALPLALAKAARKVVVNTASIYLGHMGTAQLAGVSLAVNMNEMFGEVVYGVIAPLPPLVSQAIGAGEAPTAGIWLQLVSLIVAVVSVPMAVLFYFDTEHLVSRLTDDPDVIGWAVHFNKIFCFAFLLQMLYTLLRHFANGMQETSGQPVAGVATIFANMFFLQVLMYGFPNLTFSHHVFHGFGFAGCPLAMMCSTVLAILVFMWWSFGWRQAHKKHPVFALGWTNEAFTSSRVKTYGRLAVPLMIASAAESWGARIMALACGELGAQAVGALHILMLIQGLMKAVISGVGSVIQVRVGRAIAEQQPEAAVRVFQAVMAMMLMIGLVMSGLVYHNRHYIAWCYSHDKDLVEILVSCIPMVCIDYVLCTMVVGFKSALVGMAVSDQVAVAQLAAGWFIQLPAAVYLAYYASWTSGVQGFLWGNVLGSFVRMMLLGYFLAMSDLKEQKKLARKRAKGIIKDLDTDGDGKLNKEEWVAGGGDPADFDEFDKDGNGLVDKDELQAFILVKSVKTLKQEGKLTHMAKTDFPTNQIPRFGSQ